MRVDYEPLAFDSPAGYLETLDEAGIYSVAAEIRAETARNLAAAETVQEVEAMQSECDVFGMRDEWKKRHGELAKKGK